MTHQVLISLASNYDQEQNLHQARLCLAQILSSCHYTESIWTEPFSSPLPCGEGVSSSVKVMYLNQLVYAKTTLTVDDLQSALKEMELRLGRTADDRSKGIVRIDLDLLQYDHQRYHLRDWDRPYVKDLLLSS